MTSRPRLPWPAAAARVCGVLALCLLAVMAVCVARMLVSAGPVAEFLERYPGEAPMPASTPVGFPAWASWTHFLNGFFLLLIIRTGIRARREKVATALWSSRRVKKRRMSLVLWTHLLVDALWVLNGIVFVVLLLISGRIWRILPSSIEVIPNALSAALQYATLDWPTHDSWVSYNALQQLSYAAIIFLAAPVAALSGIRLSAFWPRGDHWLNRVFPDRLARALHWPTMLFFVTFVVVHVGLVFTTGALRNLNHMYAGNDGADAVGLGIFALSLLAMLGGLALIRDPLMAKLAARFGDVRMRR